MVRILLDAFVYIILGPLILAVALIAVVSPLLALGAMWEARLGPEPYWPAFRRRFRIGWGNTIGRVITYL
jgi:hypothetical protein